MQRMRQSPRRLPILLDRDDLFDEFYEVNDNKRTPQCGPVAQLGARFHGMEEVIGSIPIRSTKQSNSLDKSSTHRQGVRVIVYVITRQSEGFSPPA
jgi:hypothetical protein